MVFLRKKLVKGKPYGSVAKIIFMHFDTIIHVSSSS